ncbi:hypothetical protein [Phenylobacterium sp.]|uniref:hypothetical protein n=1 Tax=Phenylobacterium sp. TaxID=1871053 RepID=UPI002F93F26A
MARTVLYGLSPDGSVQHSENLPDTDKVARKRLAESYLDRFHAVELWVESVCVVRVRRPAT